MIDSDKLGALVQGIAAMDSNKLGALVQNIAAMDSNKLGTLVQTIAQGSPTPMVQGIAQALSLAMDGEDDDLEQRRQRARKRLARIKRTLALMAQRNALLAGALGACECWGADADCDTCEGQGAPGFFEPVPAAFEAMVVPLLRARRDLVRAIFEGDRPPRQAAAEDRFSGTTVRSMDDHVRGERQS
jgi:hypothetical protein